MLLNITLCTTPCGQINDLGHEVKMMKFIFMSVLNILYIYFFSLDF